MDKRFCGIHVPIVTPFKKDKSLDEEGVRELVGHMIGEGLHGIVPCGTTGECPVLREDEFEKVVKISVDEANGKVPVIAGTGTNSTDASIARTKVADDLGADAFLVVTPYYNKPSQKGLVNHFKKVAACTGKPIILYNIPGRTAREISTASLIELSKVGNIAGVKDASGDLRHLMNVIRGTSDFIVLSGEDALTFPLLCLGGNGAISAVANVIGKEYVEMYNLFMKGEIDKAREIHYKTLGLVNALFIETNPAPVKAALGMMGLPSGPVRGPLENLSGKGAEILKAEMKKLGKIK